MENIYTNKFSFNFFGKNENLAFLHDCDFFNQKTILKLPYYFKSLIIQGILDEKDIKILRRTVITKGK